MRNRGSIKFDTKKNQTLMRNPSLVDKIIVRDAPTCGVSSGWEKDMGSITIQYLATIHVKMRTP